MENLLLSCIESRVENNRSFYGRFQLGPFQVGQSVTIANTIRRTLLSELSGLAIIAVEIQGVSHEYSSIKGVRESVFDILLNLKQVVLSSDKKCTQPEIGFLRIHGPGVVKTSDLKLPSFIQCVDPDQYIATLSDNGMLEMKFMICKGKNFLVETPFSLIKKSLQLHFHAQNFIIKKEEQNLSSPLLSLMRFVPNSEKIIKNSTESTSQSKPFSLKHNKSFRLASKIQSSETNLLITTRDFQEFKKILLNQKEKFKDTVLNTKHTNSINELGLELASDSLNQKLTFDEKQKNTNLLIIDPVFMPISKVNFLIENVDEFSFLSNIPLPNKRKKTFLEEKIILEVWTNGSIHPRHAIHKATQKIIDIFIPFQKTYSYKKTKFPVNSSFTVLADQTTGKKIEKGISPLNQNKLVFKDSENSPVLSLNKTNKPWRAQLKKNNFRKISEKQTFY